MKYAWNFNKTADRWDGGKFDTVGACVADARRDDAAYVPAHIDAIECDRLDGLEIWPTGEVVVTVDGWEVGAGQ